MVKKIAEKSDIARIVTTARVTKLLANSLGNVVDCAYERSGAEFQEHGPVIIAPGGFGADSGATAATTIENHLGSTSSFGRRTTNCLAELGPGHPTGTERLGATLCQTS